MSKIIDDLTDPNQSKRNLTISIENINEIAKAFSTDMRVEIFKRLVKSPTNVAEIAEIFNIPSSTAAINIKKLEDAGLIKTELIPGTRGIQKVCSVVYSKIIIDISEEEKTPENYVLIPMPIGHFYDPVINSTCGILSEESIIGEVDDVSSFFELERVNAQMIWFKQVHLEYRGPNKLPHSSNSVSLELSMETCSEAPLYNPDCPSDITLWINNVEIGTWTSLGDFGGEPRLLTPSWWGTQNTQFGLLKTWKINKKAIYIDDREISNEVIDDICINNDLFILIRIGVKQDAKNVGSINIFGCKFGNYETDILMRLDYENG